MIQKSSVIVVLLLLFSPVLWTQVLIEGYVVQADNEQSLDGVHLRLVEEGSGNKVDEDYSEVNGFFSLNGEPDKPYLVIASKEMYTEKVRPIFISAVNGRKRVSLKIELVEVVNPEPHSVIPEKKTAQEMQDRTEKLIPPDDGVVHRIVIHFSYQPLPSDHPIYFDHKDVYEYISPQHYRYYLIGSFKSEADAHDALEDQLLEKYPNAYIMSFRGKERIY